MLPFLTPLQWSIKTKAKEVFLTFDDGPIPEVTPWVLESLKKFNAKATFFCVGENVKKYPDIFLQIKEAGHRIGNHTKNHLNGWKSINKDYFENIEQCNELVSSDLFRPPYGKIKPSQITYLKSKYKLIMWNVLTKDYDVSREGEYCFNQTKKSKAGSIIVFHDSIKAEPRLKFALPKCLEYLSNEGFSFSAIG